MKRVDEHLSEVLAAVRPLAPIDLALLETHGCVLAEDVHAPGPLPPFDNSAMDGYAVRCADLVDATEDNPVRLHVLGDVMAGSWETQSVSAGSSLRIMTGAPLPSGADAVVPVEWTDGGLASVAIRRAPDHGAHIRHAGDDLSAGEAVARRGSVMHAAQLALVAAAGWGHALVHPKPRVVVLSTGDEITEPGQPLAPGKVYDANGYALTAAALETGAVAYRVGIVGDDPDRLTTTLDDHLIRADLMLTSGGVSVGARDVVKQALSALGTVKFERVAMNPGMPQGFGTVGPDDTPIFCLPGNPVSALVSYEIFVRPAIRRMAGFERLYRPTVWARLNGGPLQSPMAKRQFRRGMLEVRDDEYVVRPSGGAGSHLLAGLARANSLIVIDEDVTDVPDGDSVEVLVLGRTMR